MRNPNTAAVDVDSCRFNRLPDEILVQILNKLIDLKTLCFCKLVSTRFYSIVHQIDTISFTCNGGLPSNAPCFDFTSAFESLRNFTSLKSVSMELPSHFDSESTPAFDIMIACFQSDSFFSAVTSMNKFTGLKFLRIKLLFSNSKQEEDDVVVDYNRYLFKWKAKFSPYRLDSFCYLSPNSICRSRIQFEDDYEDDDEEEYDDNDVKMKFQIAVTCLSNAIERFSMMFNFIIYFPSMEMVSVTDLAQRGTVSVSGEKITELRNWLFSCSPPVVELPVSGYVMKGVTLVLFEREDIPDDGNDTFLNVDERDVGFEDKEVDAALYTEAMLEIFKKHRGKIETL